MTAPRLEAGAAYWKRSLQAFVGPADVAVAFRDPGGRTRTWRGRLLRLDDPGGPIVEHGGEPARLCSWEQLLSVEAVG